MNSSRWNCLPSNLRVQVVFVAFRCLLAVQVESTTSHLRPLDFDTLKHLDASKWLFQVWGGHTNPAWVPWNVHVPYHVCCFMVVLDGIGISVIFIIMIVEMHNKGHHSVALKSLNWIIRKQKELTILTSPTVFHVENPSHFWVALMHIHHVPCPSTWSVHLVCRVSALPRRVSAT